MKISKELNEVLNYLSNFKSAAFEKGMYKWSEMDITFSNNGLVVLTLSPQEWEVSYCDGIYHIEKMDNRVNVENTVLGQFDNVSIALERLEVFNAIQSKKAISPRITESDRDIVKILKTFNHYSIVRQYQKNKSRDIVNSSYNLKFIEFLKIYTES